MTSTLSPARQIFPPLLGLIGVNACILWRQRFFFFSFFIPINYKSACTVSELSETGNIKEQRDSELESMRSFSLLSLLIKLELIFSLLV